MSFIKRLSYFMIGLGIGSVMVWFMLDAREEGIQCSYFPNDRVLYDLAKKDLSFSDQATCQFACMQNDSLVLQEMLKNGDVDFDRSETDMDKCKKYYIASQWNGKTLTGIIQTCDSTATLMAFELPLTQACTCK